MFMHNKENRRQTIFLFSYQMHILNQYYVENKQIQYFNACNLFQLKSVLCGKHTYTIFNVIFLPQVPEVHFRSPPQTILTSGTLLIFY